MKDQTTDRKQDKNSELMNYINCDPLCLVVNIS